MALVGEVGWSLLLILIGVKILATSITLGAGGSGGVFAPSLFIGAMVGGAFGTLVMTLFSAFTTSSGAYALMAMGAVVAATTRDLLPQS
jgi:chloride channel protein, CIC family